MASEPEGEAPAETPAETAWLVLKGVGTRAIGQHKLIENAFEQWGSCGQRIVKDPITDAPTGRVLVQLSQPSQVQACPGSAKPSTLMLQC
jgi:hypothetical protein